MVNVVKVVGRVLVAALFLMAGLMKASPKDFPGTVAHTADSLRSSGAVAAAAKVGIDILPLAPYMVAAAAVLEVATGASLLFGKYTEAAVAATAFMVPVRVADAVLNVLVATRWCNSHNRPNRHPPPAGVVHHALPGPREPDGHDPLPEEHVHPGRRPAAGDGPPPRGDREGQGGVT